MSGFEHKFYFCTGFDDYEIYNEYVMKGIYGVSDGCFGKWFIVKDPPFSCTFQVSYPASFPRYAYILYGDAWRNDSGLVDLFKRYFPFAVKVAFPHDTQSDEYVAFTDSIECVPGAQTFDCGTLQVLDLRDDKFTFSFDSGMPKNFH